MATAVANCGVQVHLTGHFTLAPPAARRLAAFKGRSLTPAGLHAIDLETVTVMVLPRQGITTTGCGCVAPKLSQAMLAAIWAQQWAAAERIRPVFEPLENLRNAINPIRVLHEAVAAAGIAPTGPLQPLLDNVEERHRPAIATAARALAAADGQAV